MEVVSRLFMACGHSICAARAIVEGVFDLGSEKVKKSGWIMLGQTAFNVHLPLA